MLCSGADNLTDTSHSTTRMLINLREKQLHKSSIFSQNQVHFSSWQVSFERKGQLSKGLPSASTASNTARGTRYVHISHFVFRTKNIFWNAYGPSVPNRSIAGRTPDGYHSASSSVRQRALAVPILIAFKATRVEYSAEKGSEYTSKKCSFLWRMPMEILFSLRTSDSSTPQ